MAGDRHARIRRILSPTDLSDASAHASELAVMLAGRHRAHLTGLFVLSPLAFALPVPASAIGATPVSPSSDASVAESDLGRLRDEASNRFAGAAAAGVVLDVLVEVGPPVARILECASRLPADLIVMGTHGASGFEHLVVGSVAEKVLRRAPCPVLTVPPRAQVSSRVPFERVLCAVDASDSSRAALDFAFCMARQWSASMTVVHVIEWPWEEPPAPRFDELPAEQAAALAEYRRYHETQASRWLESLVPAGTPAGSNLSLRLAHGRSHDQILRIAHEESCDVIVLGVGSRSVMSRALFGSTANHVVRAATCPVLTVR